LIQPITIIVYIMQAEHTNNSNNNTHDSDRFKLLFDAYYKKLVLFADSLLLNTAAAEDIIQTVFVEVWQSGTWKNESVSIQAYLYTAVKNRCFNEIRNRNVKDSHNLLYVQAMLNVWEEGDRDDALLDELRKCIAALPRQVRSVIELRYFEGKSVSETADILQVSLNTIKTQIKRGRASLKQRLSSSQG
jgi:RNA polymerase sigma-70 factor (family 1)